MLVTLFFIGVQQLHAYDFTLSGQVLQNEAQIPAANVMVKLHIQEAWIMEVTQTDDNGDYAITVEIEEGDSIFTYSARVFDNCLGECIDKTGEVLPEGAVEDFLICEGYVPGCEAAFDFWPTFQNPMNVHFIDQSDFQPGTWYWEFGDGGTSEEKNPFHEYVEGGEYEVSLTINGADSTCFETITQLVIVEDMTMNCTANFWWHHNCQSNNPLEIKFMNNSYAYGPIISFAWDFGDGTTSDEEDPIHLYADFGLFDVSLTIETESGCTDEVTYEVMVMDWTQDCLAIFVPYISEENPWEVYFEDYSIGEITDWYWEFGDGEISDEQNPTHQYAEAALYSASLTITTYDCTSTFYYDIDLVNGTVAYSPGPTTGVVEQDALELTIYPNPVQDVLNLQFNVSTELEVQIVNISGQLLITSTHRSIDVSSLSQRVYFVKIMNNGQTTIKKFVK